MNRCIINIYNDTKDLNFKSLYIYIYIYTHVIYRSKNTTKICEMYICS